jgi:hypothetical protein
VPNKRWCRRHQWTSWVLVEQWKLTSTAQMKKGVLSQWSMQSYLKYSGLFLGSMEVATIPQWNLLYCYWTRFKQADGIYEHRTLLEILYYHVLGVAWLIIMGSGFDDWVNWHFFTITVDYNSSHTELLPNDVCLTKLSLLSESWTGLYYSRIHESTSFISA